MILLRALILIMVITILSSPICAQDMVHQWSQRFGDASDQRGRSVAADLSGNVIVTGPLNGTVDFGGGPLTSAGGSDIYVAKFDPSGNHLWSHRFGDASDQNGRSIATDASGNVIVAGSLAGTVDFGGGPLTAVGWDTFVAKFAPSGNHLWSQLFGHADAWGAAVTVDFGGAPLASAGDYDVYLAKFVAPAVPTALQGYQSSWTENHAELAWQLIDASGELSFEVSRAKDPSELFRRICDAVVYRRGDEFVFEDHTTEPGMTYTYRVIIYAAGEAVTSFETRLNTPLVAFALGQNHPNPFNPTTRITSSLDRAALVTLAIYDVSGRFVTTLAKRTMSPGPHSMEWNGRDSNGVPVASGVYSLRMTVGNRTLTRRAVLVR